MLLQVFKEENYHQLRIEKMRQQEDEDEEDQQSSSRVFYELSSMIINILGSPPFPIPFPISFLSTNFGGSPSPSSSSSDRISPTAFASLFLGISLALMMFGSAIFVIGFILMPWVISLVLLFYFAGIVSSLCDLARAVLCPPPSRHVAAWKD